MPPAASYRRTRYVASLIAASMVIAGFGMVAWNTHQEDAVAVSAGGWCCVEKGSACLNGFQALDCYNASGFVFAPEEDACLRACGLPR